MVAFRRMLDRSLCLRQSVVGGIGGCAKCQVSISLLRLAVGIMRL